MTIQEPVCFHVSRLFLHIYFFKKEVFTMDKLEYLLDLYDIELHKRLMYKKSNRVQELKLTEERISALEEIIKIIEKHN